MRNIFFALLFLPLLCAGQSGAIQKTIGFTYTAGAPTFTPSPVAKSSEIAQDTTTKDIYFWNRYTQTWDKQGRGVDEVSGASAPAYTPSQTDSYIAVNNANPPEFYVWNGSSWVKSGGVSYTAGGGIDITGNVITNTGDLSDINEIQSLSLSGQSLGITGGGTGVSLPVVGIDVGSGLSKAVTNGVYTLSNTGDLSSTNEIQALSLSGTSLTLSNGGGSVDLQIIDVVAGTGISVSKLGGAATVTNTGDTNASDDITGSGAANQIGYFTAAKVLASAATLAWTPATGAMQIGSPTNTGAFLEVKTNNNTNATFAFRIANSDNTAIAQCTNDGFFRINKFVSFSNGSGGDPAIATGGAICGLFEPAYGNLGISSFAGEAARFFGNASRQFGIGVTSGTGKLMVKGTTSDNTASVFIVQNSGGTAKFNLRNDGAFIPDATITASGTTGAQTINKCAGTVNFAAGATSLTVTNSLCSTSSIIMAIPRTNDATAVVKNIIPASGSFTINLTAAATGETSVGFWLINN